MLNLIIGKTGYGKTEYIYNEILKSAPNCDKKLFLLTPEQFSFVTERRLLTDLGESMISRVEISNFSKLYHEASKLYGGNQLEVLSDGGKAVLMKRAIDGVSDSLINFSSYKESSGFINSMISINDEFKSCGISIDDIDSISGSIENKILNGKLHDISLISSAYQSLIESEYFDSSDNLKRLYEKLLNRDYFKNRTVYIDGFTGFLQTEFKVLELIFKDAKDVYITFCADEINDSENGFGVFSHTKNSINEVLSLADKLSMKKNIIKLSENKRANNEDLLNLEKYIYANKFESVKSNGNIKLFSASNIADECDYVSRNIKSLLRNNFCRAKDIAVVCRDSDKYNEELVSSFKKYEVPFFDDQRQSITTEPLISFVEYLFRIIMFSFRTEDILSLAKTGLFGFSIDEVSNLENYVLMWEISGSKWFKNFENSPRGFVETLSRDDADLLEQINNTRKKIIKPLLYFKDCSNDKNGAEISEMVYNLLIKIGADKQLKSIAETLKSQGLIALSQQQGVVWDTLMNILNQLALTLGESVISVTEYSKLFTIVVHTEDVGIIPQGLDNVQFGQADRIRLSNPKVVFAIGCVEGEFPKAVSSGGMLTEKDRRELEKPLSLINSQLFSFGENLIVNEKYYAYMAVCSASGKVFISYSPSSSNEDSSPSYIALRTKSIFTNLNIDFTDGTDEIDLIESKKAAFEIAAKKWSDNTIFSQTLKAYFKSSDEYKDISNTIDKNIIDTEIVIEDKELSKELFSNDMIISASRIEDFYNCAFKYFCKYGLGAKARNVTKLDAMQTGTLVHYVLENIIKETGSTNLAVLDVVKRHQLVDQYIDEYFSTMLGNTSDLSNRFKYQVRRLSTLVYSVVDRLAKEFKTCNFEAKAFEMKVDKDGEIAMPIIELNDGGTIKIRGSIDRVDTYVKDDIQYVRVIDYKTGSKSFNLSDILYGINLQMFIYLFALCNDKNCELSGVPSGVLYMHSARTTVNIDSRDKMDSIVSKQENVDYKMKGIVLNDDSVITAMDNEISGKFIPVNLNSSGDLTGNLISFAEMGKVSKKINNVIKEMGNSLHNGQINPHPINGSGHKNTCDYCEYSTVCMYKKNIEPNEIVKMSNKEVLNSIEEE